MSVSAPTISAASREELVAYVKQLQQHLKEGEVKLMQIDKLEEEVETLKQKLEEKNGAVAALTEQSKMLSEMLVADEETKRILLLQMEESCVGGKTRECDSSITVSRASSALRAENNAQITPTGLKRAEANADKERIGMGEASLNPTALRSRNDEIAELEQKVRELTEVNSFYTAIVEHHDEEERVRADEGCCSTAIKAKVEGSVNLERLHERIGNLESERDNLRRLLRHNEREKESLNKELRDLREELSRLEIDVVAVEKWKVEECFAQCPAPVSLAIPGCGGSPVQGGDAVTSRTFAKVVTPIRYKGDGGKRIPKHLKRGPSVNAANEQYPLLTSPRQSRSLLQFDSLPEIHLLNPTRQEQMLLERVELYRRHVEEMSAHEVDRQRSFDEIEQARAELFTEMNFKLDEQRREIQRLNKEIALVTEGYSESRIQAKRSYHAEGTPKSAEVESLCSSETIFVPKGRAAELEVVPVGNEKNARSDSKNSIENKGVPSTGQSETAKIKHSGTLENKLFAPFEEGCPLSGSEWTWYHMDMVEKYERLDIAYKEQETFAGILMWNQIAVLSIASELMTRARGAHSEVSSLQTRLAEVQALVSSLEHQKESLVEELGRLREAHVNEPEDGGEGSTSFDVLKTNQQVFTQAVPLTEAWGPLLCVCDAYSEIVEGQIAVLRTLSEGEDATRIKGSEIKMNTASAAPPYRDVHLQGPETDANKPSGLVDTDGDEEFQMRLRGGNWLAFPPDSDVFPSDNTTKLHEATDDGTTGLGRGNAEALPKAPLATGPSQETYLSDNAHPPCRAKREIGCGVCAEAHGAPEGHVTQAPVTHQHLQSGPLSWGSFSNAITSEGCGDDGTGSRNTGQLKNALENLFCDANASQPATYQETREDNSCTFAAEFDPFA
ncbi:hypothetical protein, conserved [Trypanosoma brucei gambiense DAL972]|uniref:Uncharacterized protein n=1 Tax=Trypanosoma brucei gambiense (strain MHOM/CI/86/DAL972) TaxID=679716 RepID=C9ZV64_TRYB9|nr:hypothetical protein, conserved [Trypanosoma brucei gambiense DAL972]CBH13302.1 hypothetical protein, conserved [Trypanosoma brucei gambiense DAL972]|eukprot:XP_011775579.1 hypothetical protein, conserved [Trypanosoma brucei gambiense DAL972]